MATSAPEDPIINLFICVLEIFPSISLAILPLRYSFVIGMFF
jgi:hypothetical protein